MQRTKEVQGLKPSCKKAHNLAIIIEKKMTILSMVDRVKEIREVKMKNRLRYR